MKASKSLALWPGLIAASAAFLMPPDLSGMDLEKLPTSLGAARAMIGTIETVILDCDGCSVPIILNDGTTVQDTYTPSKLELNFDIVPHENDPTHADTVIVNGMQLYPPTREITRLQGIQSTADGEFMQRLGYGLSILPAIKSKDATDSGLELIEISLQIVEVGGKVVPGLQRVSIQVLSAGSPAQLMIHAISLKPTTGPFVSLGDGNDKKEGCAKKWRHGAITKEIMAEAIADDESETGIPSECGRGHGRGRKDGSCDRFPSGAPRPHHRHGGGAGHRGHNRHGHGHRHHSKMQKIISAIDFAIFNYILPMVGGIVAGYLVGVIGVLVGRFVVFLWRALYRGGSRGQYSEVEQSESEACERAADEKVMSKEMVGEETMNEKAIEG